MKSILLDRDSTLNYDPGYLNDHQIVKLLPKVITGLSLLKEFGYTFFVVSNQSGVARGLISESQLRNVNDKISKLLSEAGIEIKKWYICKHRDEDQCDCRKPKDGLIKTLLSENEITINQSYIIGDRTRDIACALSSNIRGILLENEVLGEPETENLIFKCQNLEQAANFILENEFDILWQKKWLQDQAQLNQWKKDHQKQTIVFTNGCFDILHPGHMQYLKMASSLGDQFVIGLNSDASVAQLKGDSRPINNLNDRITMLAQLDFVDAIIPFEESTPIRLIENLKPNIHIKGGDYKIEELPEYKTIKEYGGRVIILPFREGYSTSNIIKNLS